MSGSLNSKLAAATLEWMFELSDKVFVVYAMDSYGSSIAPTPPVDLPVTHFDIWVKDKIEKLKLLRLNISSQATSSFLMSDEGLSFKCRFSGTMADVFISYDSIVRLECPEIDSAQEFTFVVEPEHMPSEQSKTAQEVEPAPAPKRSHLSIVK